MEKIIEVLNLIPWSVAWPLLLIASWPFARFYVRWVDWKEKEIELAPVRRELIALLKKRKEAG